MPQLTEEHKAALLRLAKQLPGSHPYTLSLALEVEVGVIYKPSQIKEVIQPQSSL